MGGFGAAIVFAAQAADAGVFGFFKNEDAVDDRDLPPHLDLRERMGHAPADVLRVAGLALKNHAQANNGRKARRLLFRQCGGHRRNLKRTRHADDLDFGRARALQHRRGRPHHRVHVPRVVARGDDGEGAAFRLDFCDLTILRNMNRNRVTKDAPSFPAWFSDTARCADWVAS